MPQQNDVVTFNFYFVSTLLDTYETTIKSISNGDVTVDFRGTDWTFPANKLKAEGNNEWESNWQFSEMR